MTVIHSVHYMYWDSSHTYNHVSHLPRNRGVNTNGAHKSIINILEYLKSLDLFTSYVCSAFSIESSTIKTHIPVYFIVLHNKDHL